MNIKKIIQNLVWTCLPKFVQVRIKDTYESKRVSLQLQNFKYIVTNEDIDKLFMNLNVNSDLMIHSSFPDIGNIKSPKYIVNKIYEIINNNHTVLFPAIPIKGSTLEFLKKEKEIDFRTLSNAMGYLSVKFEKEKDSYRSLNPTHSVVAIGVRAEWYTSEHHYDETPFTIKSPYYKLLKRKGKILMFGATLDHLTILHVVEDMLGFLFPYNIYSKSYTIKIITKNNESFISKYRTHNKLSGILRDITKIKKNIKELPSTKVYKVGAGEVVLIDAKDLMILILKLLRQGQSTMGRVYISSECKKQINYWINKVENDNL